MKYKLIALCLLAATLHGCKKPKDIPIGDERPLSVTQISVQTWDVGVDRHQVWKIGIWFNKHIHGVISGRITWHSNVGTTVNYDVSFMNVPVEGAADPNGAGGTSIMYDTGLVNTYPSIGDNVQIKVLLHDGSESIIF